MLQKTIEVGGREITFSEIPVNKILMMLRGNAPLYALPVSSALDELSSLIPFAIDCSIDELLDLELYSADMAKIEEAFKETNPGFFDMARRLDLLAALKTLIKAVIGAYCSRLPSLPSVDTVTPKTTVLGSSSI